MAFKFAPDSWIASVGDGASTLNFVNRQINRENVLAPGEVAKSGANTLAGDDFIPAFIGYARIEGADLSSLDADDQDKLRTRLRVRITATHIALETGEQEPAAPLPHLLSIDGEDGADDTPAAKLVIRGRREGLDILRGIIARSLIPDEGGKWSLGSAAKALAGVFTGELSVSGLLTMGGTIKGAAGGFFKLPAAAAGGETAEAAVALSTANDVGTPQSFGHALRRPAESGDGVKLVGDARGELVAIQVGVDAAGDKTLALVTRHADAIKKAIQQLNAVELPAAGEVATEYLPGENQQWSIAAGGGVEEIDLLVPKMFITAAWLGGWYVVKAGVADSVTSENVRTALGELPIDAPAADLGGAYAANSLAAFAVNAATLAVQEGVIVGGVERLTYLTQHNFSLDGKLQARVYEVLAAPDGTAAAFKAPLVRAGDIARQGRNLWVCTNAGVNAADAVWERMSPEIAAGVVSAAGNKIGGFGFSSERDELGKFTITFEKAAESDNYSVCVTTMGEFGGAGTLGWPVVARYHDKTMDGFKIDLISVNATGDTDNNRPGLRDAEFSFVATQY